MTAIDVFFFSHQFIRHSVYKQLLLKYLVILFNDYRSSWKRTTVSWADSRGTKTSAVRLRIIRRHSWKSCFTWPPGCKPRPVKKRIFKRCVHASLVKNAFGIRILFQQFITIQIMYKVSGDLFSGLFDSLGGFQITNWIIGVCVVRKWTLWCECIPIDPYPFFGESSWGIWALVYWVNRRASGYKDLGGPKNVSAYPSVPLCLGKSGPKQFYGVRKVADNGTSLSRG